MSSINNLLKEILTRSYRDSVQTITSPPEPLHTFQADTTIPPSPGLTARPPAGCSTTA